MANQLVIVSTPVPFNTERRQIPVLYVDIHGDGSAYAPASFEQNTGLGTAHTDGFQVTHTAQTIVDANLNRSSLLIVNNDDTNPIWIKAGGGVTADYFSMKVGPGKSYATDKTSDSYEAIAATGITVQVTVEEVATDWLGG